MENCLVSARMSVAKKEAGVHALEAIGATATELINDAFDYVIERRRLPGREEAFECKRGSFADFVQATTFEVDWGPDEGAIDYKQLLHEGKRSDYESLA